MRSGSHHRALQKVTGDARRKPRKPLALVLTDDGSGPYLRTGDLGVLIDGELFVAGRLKDLLIVRGFKHYPQDLELTVERQHPAIRPGCVAVFALEAHDEHIAVAAELDPRRLDITRTNPLEFLALSRARAISQTRSPI